MVNNITKVFAVAHFVAILVIVAIGLCNPTSRPEAIFWGVGVVLGGLIEFRLRHKPGPPWQAKLMLIGSGWVLVFLAIVGRIVYACKTETN